MKLGLHAYSLLLAGGLREYQPVGRGELTAEQLLDKAAQLKCHAVQLARKQLGDRDPVALARIRSKAEELGILLHVSTNLLDGEHLVEMIHAAYNMGAPQVTVNISRLKGNVQIRQRALERLLLSLDVAINRAKRYRIVLAFENGRHTAAVDLAALIQAAESEWVAACFDMGNPLTVPEDPIASAKTLAPFCRSIHLKDVQVYRTREGALLLNCPVGDGVLPVTDVLRALKQAEVPIFLQTGAERVVVPVLDDTFLQEYPRITARALASLLRQGAMPGPDTDWSFPHERKAVEREILKWEDDRLKRSMKQAHKILGTESLTLPMG